MQVLVDGTSGPVNGKIVGEVPVNNKPFVVVDLGVGAYIRGVYTKFAIVPAHLILNRELNDVRIKE